MFNRKTEVINFKEFMGKGNTDFFASTPKKEVIATKIKDLSIKTYAVVLPSILVTEPVLAQQGTGIPEVDSGFLKVQLVCIGLSSGIAVLCLMADGALKMLGIERPDWTKKIYKGLIQVITAPLAVAIVVTLIQWGQKIFSFH